MTISNKIDKSYFDGFIAEVTKKVEVDFIDKCTLRDVERIKDFNLSQSDFKKMSEVYAKGGVDQIKADINEVKNKKYTLIFKMIICSILFLIGGLILVRSMKEELGEVNAKLKENKDLFKFAEEKSGLTPLIESLVQIGKDLNRGFSIEIEGKKYKDTYEVFQALNGLGLTPYQKTLILLNAQQAIFVPLAIDNHVRLFPLAQTLVPLTQADGEAVGTDPNNPPCPYNSFLDQTRYKNIKVTVEGGDVILETEIANAMAVYDPQIQEGDIVAGVAAKAGETARPIISFNAVLSCNVGTGKMTITRELNAVLI